MDRGLRKGISIWQGSCTRQRSILKMCGPFSGHTFRSHQQYWGGQNWNALKTWLSTIRRWKSRVLRNW